jgi:hypothetical protein
MFHIDPETGGRIVTLVDLQEGQTPQIGTVIHVKRNGPGEQNIPGLLA